MKKIKYIYLLFFLSISIVGSSQIYNAAIGGRYGDVGRELTFKKLIHYATDEEKLRFIDAGIQLKNHDILGIGAYAMVTDQARINDYKNFWYYYGAGIHAGSWAYANPHSFFDRSYAQVGLMATVGFEAIVKERFSFGLDWRPQYNGLVHEYQGSVITNKSYWGLRATGFHFRLFLIKNDE